VLVMAEACVVGSHRCLLGSNCHLQSFLRFPEDAMHKDSSHQEFLPPVQELNTHIAALFFDESRCLRLCFKVLSAEEVAQRTVSPSVQILAYLLFWAQPAQRMRISVSPILRPKAQHVQDTAQHYALPQHWVPT
jgi:hypothetical protein